jgi:hypothetical protein
VQIYGPGVLIVAARLRDGMKSPVIISS